MKDKEYHFATFVSKTLAFSPPKMMNLISDQLNTTSDKTFELTKSSIWVISKWM